MQPVDFISPEIEPTPPVLEGEVLNRWTTREVPRFVFLKII